MQTQAPDAPEPVEETTEVEPAVVQAEQPAGVVYVTRCADCRREIFDNGDGRMLHWNPVFDNGPFAHEAVLEKR